MIKDYEYLRRNKKFEKKIRIACDFHSAKYEFTQGRILNVDRTNVSFIEPHRFLIKLNGKKIVILYFDGYNMFLYNLEVRFIAENKIDSYEELHCYKEVCKEALDDLIYARKRTYEQKYKSKDNRIKEECDMKIAFYNESIIDFQTKVKTCNTIEENNKRMIKEFNKEINKNSIELK